MDKSPLIAITLGDPAGIGPEIIVKAFGSGSLSGFCRPLVVGDAACLERAARSCDLPLKIRPTQRIEEAEFDPATLDVLDLKNVPTSLTLGTASAEGGRASVEYIQRAADLAMQGRAEAIVTAPINKKAIAMAGFHWPGHTELLAEHTGSPDFALMMIGKRLRVSLVTLHEAVSRVPSLISEQSVYRTLKLTRDWLARYVSETPRIAVLGLNPHCGEDGRFGDEEPLHIVPAVRRAREEGILCDGPHPADAFFGQGRAADYDAVVAMYHDQGLIPVKVDAMGEAVNVTLGIPILRASVDHGTAYDIAGRNRASCSSLLAALKTAARFSHFPVPTHEKT